MKGRSSMILYDTNEQFQRHMAEGRVVVADYKLSKSGNLLITLLDEGAGKKVECTVSNYTISNEQFEILNQPVKTLLLRDFRKIYRSSKFAVGMIQVINRANPQQIVTITGGSL